MKNHTANFYIRILLVSVLVYFCFVKPVSGYSTDGLNEAESPYETHSICHVLLEPLQPGKSISTILMKQCGTSSQLTLVGLNTTYLIANFYDNTN